MKRRIIFSVIFCFASVFAFTQQSSLKINIQSTEGEAPISGVSLKISCDALMQSLESVTDVDGSAVFYNLPMGFYDISIIKEGYKNENIEKIRIGFDKNVRIYAYLRTEKEADEGIPGKDFKYFDDAKASFSYEYDLGDWLGHLPVLKNLINVLLLPGGVTGRETISVLGSGALDNLFYIDGAFDVDPYTQEMALVTGVDYLAGMHTYLTCLPAEYGLATGGVTELFTTSGSNRYHGAVNLLLRRNGWNDISVNDPDKAGDDAREGSSGDNWTFTAGGFLWRDAIWWRLSYETKNIPQQIPRRISPLLYNEYEYEEQEADYHTISFKGNFLVSQNLKGSIVYLDDYAKYYNEGTRVFTGRKTMESADRSLEQENEIFSAALSYLLDDSVLLEGSWSSLTYRYDQVTQDGTQTEGISFSSYDNWYWGSVPYLGHQENSIEKIQFSANFNIDMGAENDIKIGGEFRNNGYVLQRRSYPSNVQILTNAVEGVGFDAAEWIQKIVYEDRFPETTNEYDIFSFYLQDSVSIGDNIVIEAGIRFDSHQMYNNLDDKVYSLGLLETASPRIGIAYSLEDFTFRGSYAKYYDQLWMEMAYEMNVSSQETKYYYLPADGVDGRNGWVLSNVVSYKQNSGLNSISDDLVPQNSDEFALGFEWAISDSLNFTAYGVMKVYRDLVVAEDQNTDNVTVWQNVVTDEYGSKWKTWNGLVFDFRKRPKDDGLFLNVDFTFCREENLYGEDSNYLTYLISPIMRADNAGEWWGISDGPTMQLSFQGFYIFPNDWYAGITIDWNNGAAYTTKGLYYVDGFGNFEFCPNGRGDIERMPDAFQMNLQFGVVADFELPFDNDIFGSNAALEIYIKINNLTDYEYPLAVNVTNSSATYLSYTDWNRARWYQLGFNFSF